MARRRIEWEAVVRGEIEVDDETCCSVEERLADAESEEDLQSLLAASAEVYVLDLNYGEKAPSEVEEVDDGDEARGADGPEVVPE